MFTVTKRLEVSASHQLKLDYPSKCQNLHGHNWIITVHARSEELDHNGMVIDFTIIKEKNSWSIGPSPYQRCTRRYKSYCGEYGKMDR